MPFCFNCDLFPVRLAKEEELRGALTKAEDLEKENLDLMTKLSEKEQECDVRTQERDDLSSSLSRLQEKFETESMGKEVLNGGLGFQRRDGYFLAAALSDMF